MSFAGRILVIDLSNDKVSTKSSTISAIIKEYIGGFGLCTKLACELVKPDIEPLNPSNPLVIGAGLLVGTNAPAASRVYLLSPNCQQMVPSDGEVVGELHSDAI